MEVKKKLIEEITSMLSVQKFKDLIISSDELQNWEKDKIGLTPLFWTISN